MKAEEKKEQVLKVAENKEIPENTEAVLEGGFTEGQESRRTT